eukprot:COSAG06_NODE_1760_length_8452_cov_6.300012_8_plen_71_part_00
MQNKRISTQRATAVGREDATQSKGALALSAFFKATSSSYGTREYTVFGGRSSPDWSWKDHLPYFLSGAGG